MSSEIRLKKTPWYKMIKIKRRCKKFNKKYGNQSFSPEEINIILMEWYNDRD